MVSLLGERLIFYSLGTTKISRSFQHSACINFVILINFPEQLNYASASNIWGIIKFYNLGNKSFETDFNFDLDGRLLPGSVPIQIRGGALSIIVI